MGNSTYWEKKISLIAFNKHFACSMHSGTQLWLIWKSSSKTKSLNTKPCPVGLSRRIICQAFSLLTKNVTKLLCPPGVDCFPFPKTFMGNPGDEEKSYPIAKNLLICPIRKIPLDRFNLSQSKVSFLPLQTVIFKKSSYAIFICSCSHFCCIIF